MNPTKSTDTPTINPSKAPTNTPTFIPTKTPTQTPTINPTKSTDFPTFTPTIFPTTSPTINPTQSTDNPTITPTNNPTISPTNIPTYTPSNTPTNDPTVTPTYNPTVTPTESPTVFPSNQPTSNPTNSPTVTTIAPSLSPTLSVVCNQFSIPTQIIVSQNISETITAGIQEFLNDYIDSSGLVYGDISFINVNEVLIISVDICHHLTFDIEYNIIVDELIIPIHETLLNISNQQFALYSDNNMFCDYSTLFECGGGSASIDNIKTCCSYNSEEILIKKIKKIRSIQIASFILKIIAPIIALIIICKLPILCLSLIYKCTDKDIDWTMVGIKDGMLICLGTITVFAIIVNILDWVTVGYLINGTVKPIKDLNILFDNHCYNNDGISIIQDVSGELQAILAFCVIEGLIGIIGVIIEIIGFSKDFEKLAAGLFGFFYVAELVLTTINVFVFILPVFNDYNGLISQPDSSYKCYFPTSIDIEPVSSSVIGGLLTPSPSISPTVSYPSDCHSITIPTPIDSLLNNNTKRDIELLIDGYTNISGISYNDLEFISNNKANYITFDLCYWITFDIQFDIIKTDLIEPIYITSVKGSETNISLYTDGFLFCDYSIEFECGGGKYPIEYTKNCCTFDQETENKLNKKIINIKSLQMASFN